MTVPAVAARTTTADPAATISRAIGLGAPNAGDLLIVFVSTTSAGGDFLIDPASGNWDRMTSAGNITRIGVFAKVAAGGGTDALTLITLAAVRMSAVCYRITGHGSTVAIGAFATATSGTAGNPPAVSITGAAQDVLFLAALAGQNSVATVAPASYGTLTTIAAGTSSAMSSAERGIAATTTDDPGAFANPSQEWVAVAVAIPELAITTNARATQAGREIVSRTDPSMRTTQVGRELVSRMDPSMRASQVGFELVSTNVPNDAVGDGPGMLLIAT